MMMMITHEFLEERVDQLEAYEQKYAMVWTSECRGECAPSWRRDQRLSPEAGTRFLKEAGARIQPGDIVRHHSSTRLFSKENVSPMSAIQETGRNSAWEFTRIPYRQCRFMRIFYITRNWYLGLVPRASDSVAKTSRWIPDIPVADFCEWMLRLAWHLGIPGLLGS